MVREGLNILRILCSEANSPNHGQFGAGELALEEPMAEVDGQIDLVVLGYVNDRFLVLHVHGDELVADLGRVLGVVHKAELLVGDIGLELRVVFELDALAFDLLAPAILVQAFAEKDHVG